MNIYEKILAIMNEVQYLAKDDHVSFGSTSYKALSEEKVTSVMRQKLVKYKLIVYPIAQTANRTGNITHVDVVYRMVNVEAPEEYIEIASCGDGADTQDNRIEFHVWGYGQGGETWTIDHHVVFGNPATNKQISMLGITVFQVADGKIAKLWNVWDLAGLLNQLKG